jgi:phosphatidylglycerol lysyltransferase
MGSRIVSRYPTRRIVVSAVVAFMGLINIASAYFSHPSDRLLALRRLVPTQVLDSSRTFTLLAGLLLLITAWGLRRGKRESFVAALFLVAASVPLNVLKAADVEEASAAAALMFLLGVSAEAFRVQSRGFTWSGLGSRAMASAATLLAYAVTGCWWLEARYGLSPSPGRATSEALYRLLGIGGPALRLDAAQTSADLRIIQWYLRSLPLLGGTLLVALALASLRPALYRRRRSAAGQRITALVEAHGDSTISYFALEPGCDYFFSENNRAALAYRFESDVLVTIGDPIGPREEFEPLLRRFESWCRDNDWEFAIFQSRPEYREIYERLGWRFTHIGEDAILWTNHFTLEGGVMGDVRRATRKAEAAGIEFRSFRPGQNPFERTRQSESLYDELHQVSNLWLQSQAGSEKGFCMSRFETARLAQHWLAIAWNPTAQRVEAFVSWLPVPARRGWALDLTRRRPDAAHGAMEFLIVHSMEEARASGAALLSLALSALAMVNDPGSTAPSGSSQAETVGLESVPASPDEAKAESPPTPDTREGELFRRVREVLHRRLDPEEAREFLRVQLARFYDFKGLFHWKKKFAPAFEDRFVVYRAPLSLPRIAVAFLRLESPGGLRQYVADLVRRR